MPSNPATTNAKDAEPAFVPIGVVPDMPPNGWTKAIIVNNKWTAFEKDWMDCNLILYRQKKGEARHNLVGWVSRQIHNLWGDTYGDESVKEGKLYQAWKKRKKVSVDFD